MTKLEVGAVKFQNYFNRIFPSSKSSEFVSVIITAAGNGVRMGGVSKPLFPIHGSPCLMYSLRAFSQCEKVGEIIISVRECDQEVVESLCGRYCSNKPFSVVIGGETRQESVANAFSHVHEKSDFVMIHDAARPLIGEREILLLIEKGKRYGAACAGEKVVDTVKEIGKNGFISKTVPRDHLYTVQTPQIFRTDLYRVALALAKRDGISVTDDCALAEHAGFPVHICELGIFNMKLTTMQDVEKIEMIIREKGKIL